MKTVSRGLALEVSARVATQVNWDSLDGTKLHEEVASLSPEEFGRRFTAFLKAGARFSFGGLKVATVPFDLEKFISEHWTFWRGPKEGDGLKGEEERDKASLALTEVDFEKSDFLTCLEEGVNCIIGEGKLIRLKKLNRPLYGANVFMGLWEDYQQNKVQSVLEKLYQWKGIAYIDFFGDILRDSGGSRNVPYLFRGSDGSWGWDCYLLSLAWGGRDLTAVSQQVSS